MVGTHDAFTTAVLQTTKFDSHPDLGRSTLQITELSLPRHDFRIELAYRIAQTLEQNELCRRILLS